MNKEIKEISDIISDHIEFCDVGGGSASIDEDEAAKAIYNAGYRKTIWHKVADGDWPVNLDYVLCLTKLGLMSVGFVSKENLWHLESAYDDYYDSTPDIIAWTELPEYKE